jgi:hypothetical protein
MKILERVLSMLFGAVLFSIIAPVVYHLSFGQFPFESLKGLAAVIGIGFIVGAILGAMFPRVFGFVVTFFLGE